MPSAAETIIRAGYGDRFKKQDRSLHFRVEITKRDVDVISLVEEYNNFIGSDAAAMVGEIFEADAAYQVEFGREGSTVLYVWAKPGELKRVTNALRALHPDELDPDGQNRMRAWWD